jgi:hypothetical protein
MASVARVTAADHSIRSRTNHTEAAATTDPALALQVPVRRVLWCLFAVCLFVEVSLVVLDATINYGEWVTIAALQEFLNTAAERALPAWIAVTQTWMVALTLAALALATALKTESRWRVIGWGLLALFFAYMSMDDGTAFHERLGGGVENRFAVAAGSLAEPTTPLLGWFPSYGWQLALGPVFLGVGLFMVVFLWRQFANTGFFVLVVVGLGLMALAVGLDFIEGLDRSHPWNLHVSMEHRFELDSHSVRHFSKSFEEFLEMLGTTLLWIAFLGHLMARLPVVQLRFNAERS